MQMYEICDKQGIWIDDVHHGTIQVNGKLYDHAVCITDRMVLPVTKISATELITEDFRQALINKPEIILIGTGAMHVFIHPKTTVELVNNGIGIESMNTDAAFRTYTLLRGEGRNVWAWLWPIST